MTDGDRGAVRYFSLEEANRTLPLVRRIVEDILAEQRDEAPRPEALAELVEELTDLGCLFKGLQDGLVDWYSHYAGRPVFLCWKHGEPEIAWWHQIDAGFAGRQPILPSQRSAFRAEADARPGS
jgi:hypothetical protein